MGLRVLGVVIASFVILAQAPQPPTKAAPAKPQEAAPAPKVVHVPPDEVVAILGQPVAGPDGKTIGRLIDVLVNEDGNPTAGVIDIGGFMGVGVRRIAVRWAALHFAPGATKQPISLDWTINQIKAAPEYGSNARPAPVVVAAPKPAHPAGPPAKPGEPTQPTPSAPQTSTPPRTPSVPTNQPAQSGTPSVQTGPPAQPSSPSVQTGPPARPSSPSVQTGRSAQPSPQSVSTSPPAQSSNPSRLTPPPQSGPR
jgi:hypothetical protein